MDYGSDKRSFLEAVPTYTNVIPALQLGNAGMLLALANLTESLGGSAADVAAMRGNGTAIVADAVKFSYIPGTGFWQCLDFNGTSSGVHVRALSDFMYAGQALGVTAGNASAYLPASLRSEAVAYFNAELLANGWVRALFGLFDMLMHTQHKPQDDLQLLLEQVRDEVAVVRPPAWSRTANTFSHIFAGGYAAGYYSYKWAEVLSADAYAAFEETAATDGTPNVETGTRFRRAILEAGGSRPAMESFKVFRGREPTLDALLRHQGMSA